MYPGFELMYEKCLMSVAVGVNHCAICADPSRREGRLQGEGWDLVQRPERVPGVLQDAGQNCGDYVGGWMAQDGYKIF